MDFEKPLGTCTVLYVEDDREIRDYVVSFLASRVRTLWIAENGEEGLELFHAHSPDIVVTDLKMPRLDGVGMAKRIRFEDAEVPIVLTASYSDEHRLFDAIEAKICAFVKKPVKISDLLHTLEEIAKKITYERTQKRVQASMAQHYLAIEEEALLIYIDDKGKIKKINEPMALKLNYPSALLEHEPFESLIYKDGDPEKYASLFKAIENGDSWHGEIHLLAQRELEMTFKATLVPIYDTDRPVHQFMMLLEDITEVINYRKLLKNELDETQTTLQEKIHFLEQYQNAINEGTAICRFLEDGTILRTDRRFDQIFGFDGDRTHRRSFYQLCPNIENSLRSEIMEAVRRRQTLRKRMRCIDCNDNLHVTDSVFIPIYKLDGEIEEIISIHNDITDIIKLGEEIQNTQKELLYILGEVAESRSRETSDHVKRVAEYSRLLAELAGLDDEEIELLYVVAPMHDVGKIAIPDNILLKEGPLTPEECEEMKKHAVIGGELFGRSERPFMKAARIVALEHHENFDGSGYPYGKKGEEIHIFGRIVAIADVFDALSMNRVYKQRWPIEKVVEYMQKERGKKFDPTLIDLFLKNLDLFLEIRNNFAR